MDWVVFGDDWGAHPSTTQHLVRHLPDGDRVVWVNSIGMRAPRLTRSDGVRVLGRLQARLRLGAGATREPQRSTNHARFRVVTPTVIPWHGSPLARLANRALIARAVDDARRALKMGAVHALLANPVAARYLDALPVRRVGYLRLDDYPHLPGVDPALVRPAEQDLYRRADVIFGTARALLPAPDAAAGRLVYLPQGVDQAHFAGPAHPVPDTRVIGFFGLIAEWIDGALVSAVARAHPDWTFEFVGPVRAVPAGLASAPNVVLKPGVPYAALPAAIAHWRAGWVPFEVTTLTEGVNPLKLREYLAAGLPAASTALPEAVALSEDVHIVRTPGDLTTWLRGAVAQDDSTARAARREGMRAHGWSARAEALRRAMGGES